MRGSCEEREKVKKWPARRERKVKMRKVKVVRADLDWEEKLPWKTKIPHLLRGAISSMYPEETLLHQHQGEETVYRYPKVQFRWEEGKGVLVGFQEGAEVVGRLPLVGRVLPLGEYTRRVKEVKLSYEETEVRESEELQGYALKTAWLALNQERHRAYQEMTLDGRLREIERLAVGAILMAMKGVGIDVTWKLKVKMEDVREIPSTFKGLSFLGIEGVLKSNVVLPEGLGIGKATSHGYGWLVRSEGKSRVELAQAEEGKPQEGRGSQEEGAEVTSSEEAKGEEVDVREERLDPRWVIRRRKKPAE